MADNPMTDINWRNAPLPAAPVVKEMTQFGSYSNEMILVTDGDQVSPALFEPWPKDGWRPILPLRGPILQWCYVRNRA
jgi:hypothetical protein